VDLMLGRHPRNTDLQAWLTGPTDPGVEAHVATCPRCAARLEELEEVAHPATGAGEPGGGVAAALTQALAPPEGLTERLVAGVNARLSSRQILGIAADVLAAGLETTRLLLFEDDADDDD
jgi:anti-sigma factor RsiW